MPRSIGKCIQTYDERLYPGKTRFSFVTSSLKRAIIYMKRTALTCLNYISRRSFSVPSSIAQPQLELTTKLTSSLKLLCASNTCCGPPFVAMYITFA